MIFLLCQTLYKQELKYYIFTLLLKIKKFFKNLFTKEKLYDIISNGLLLCLVYGPAPFGKIPLRGLCFSPAQKRSFMEINYRKVKKK